MTKINPYFKDKIGLQAKTPAAASDSENKSKVVINPYFRKQPDKSDAIRQTMEYLQNKPEQPKVTSGSEPVKIGTASMRQDIGQQMFPYTATMNDAGAKLQQKANSMPSYMQGERPVDVKLEKAWVDVVNGQQTVDKLKAEADESVEIAERIKRSERQLASMKMGIDNLYAQYQQTGDETLGRAYLMAAENYNKQAEACRKDYAGWEKKAGKVDEYNRAVLDLQLKNMAFTQAQEEHNKKVEEEKPENKSEKDLQKMIDEIDHQIYLERRAGLEERAPGWWMVPADMQPTLKYKNQATIDELEDQKQALLGLIEQKQSEKWEAEKEQEILAAGGTELMNALLNYAEQLSWEETNAMNRATTTIPTINQKLVDAAKEIERLGVSEEQLENWMPYAKRMYNARVYDETTKMMKSAAQSGPGAAAALSVLSVPLNLTSGTGIVDITIQKLARKASGSDVPVDYKGKSMSGYNMANAIRTSVTESIEKRTAGKAGSDTMLGNLYSSGYNLLMSMGDSLGVAALTAMGVPGATLLLGGSAATATMMEVKERGGSDGQALTMGWVAGIAEALFEKVSLDTLIKTKDPTSWKIAITNILKQSGVEASEEVSTTVANTIADSLVMGDKSAINETVRQLMEQGMPKAMAEKEAMRQWFVGLLGDAIGGAISGGLFGVGNNAIQADWSNVGKKKSAAKSAAETEGNGQAVENLMAENVEGVAEYGTQNIERETGADASTERETAVGTGGSTIEQRGQDVGENVGRTESGNQIKSYVDDLRRNGKLITMDARTAGLSAAADGSLLEVIPEEAYTSTMKHAAQKARAMGVDVMLTANPIIRENNGKRKKAVGIYENGKIIVQANATSADVETVMDHEIYHALSRSNPEMAVQAKESFEKQYDEAALQELYEQYEMLYTDAYAGKNVSSEEVAKRIHEEIMADAYANRDRYGKGEQFERAAKAVRETVEPEVTRKTAQKDVGRYREVTTEDVLESVEQESTANREFRERIEDDTTLKKWKRQLKRGEIDQTEYARRVDQYFEQRLQKEVDDLVAAEGQFSLEEDPYTYEALISKPDMIVTMVDEREIPTKRKKLDTTTIAVEARNKAETLYNETRGEQRYIWIEDLGARVMVPRKGFEHGLLGNKTNSGTMRTAEVTYDLTDILKNSVAVNELNKREGEDHEHSYILFGYAKRKTDGKEYIVKSTVYHYGINKSVVDEMEIYDVLKGAKAKNVEPEVIGSHTGTDPAASVLNASGSTTISIAELLETVKENYPELLPDDVREHFGIQDAEKEASARYSIDEENDEDREAYWKSLMEDPGAEMPQRIRLADKQTMEAWAKENGYPEQNGIQIVPGVTWVKAKGRQNYGRVIGKSANGAYMVMFENRERGTEAVVEYRADEFDAVQGELQYEGKELDRTNQIETVPAERETQEPVQVEEQDVQGDNLTELIRHTAGGLESFMAAQSNKVQNTYRAKVGISAIDLAEAMSIENNETLQNIVRQLAEEYMELGTITKKLEEQAFEEILPMKEKPERQSEQEFKAWARADFEDGVRSLMANVKIVRRYIKHQNDAKAEGEKTENKEQEVETIWKEAKSTRKEIEKLKAIHLLTPEDRVMIGRLLKGYIQMEDIDPNVYNVRGIREVYELSQKYEDLMKMLRAYNAARRAANRATVRELVPDPEKWKDKKMGTSYSTETMERNVEDIAPDAETAKALINWAFTPVHKNEANATRLKNEMRDRVRALGLKTGKPQKRNKLSESAAVQLLGEAQDNIRMLEHRKQGERRDGKTLEEWKEEVANIWTESPGLDRAKIERAVKEFREIYDQLFRMMNEARIRNGFEPVNYRKGYFPHFQEQEADGIISAFGQAFGIMTEVANLPATINGMTENFKPGIRWFGNALERLGFQTTMDAVQGFDQYIEGVADVIFHTDDIQRLRALESEIRYQAANEQIRERADKIRAREDLNDAQKSEEIKKLFKDAPYALSKFVVEIHEYTNALANKRSKFDRWFEDKMGRGFYNVMKAVEGRVAANMVAINPGSWLTNFAPLVQGQTSIGGGWILAGMWQENKNFVKKITTKQTDGFPERSVFLTNRRGSEKLIKTGVQKVSETLAMPMGWIDNFVSDSLVRAKYMKNMKDGLSAEAAMDDADAWAARIMADRSKGALPTVFNEKNPITKLFTQYQVEVKNQFSWLLKDLPREKRKKGIARIAWALMVYAIRAYIFNDLYEYFVGRRAAFDPADLLLSTSEDIWGFDVPNVIDLIAGKDRDFEGEKAEAAEIAGNLFKNIMEEVPFVGGLIGGGRIPISSALPDWQKLGNAVFAKIDDPETEEKEGMSKEQKTKSIFNEMIKPGLYIIPPFGGGQAKKIIESVRAFEEHGSYTPSGELRYPVYTSDGWGDWKTYATGLIFGASSLNEAEQWVDSGFKNLNEKYTGVYRLLIEQGETDRDAYALVKAVNDAKKTDEESAEVIKRRVLQQTDASDEAKLTVYRTVLASESEVKLMEQLAESDAGEVYGLLNDMYGKKDAQKRDIIMASALSETEKETAWLWTKGSGEDEQEKAEDRLELGKEYGLRVDEIAEMENAGASFNRLEKMLEAGVSGEAAYELSLTIEELKPEAGREKVSDYQIMDAIAGAGLSSGDQQKAIGTMLSDNQKKHFDILMEEGMTVKQYVQYQKKTAGLEADKDASGKAIPGSKKEKVLAAIDAMPVTDAVKDALYLSEGYGESGLDDAPWHQGGIMWAGR